jgi:hypothetical protein
LSLIKHFSAWPYVTNFRQISQGKRGGGEVLTKLPGGVRVLVLDKVDTKFIRLVVNVLQLLQDGVALHTLVVI